MVIAIKSAILQKARRLIGLPRPEQISDNDLTDYLDSFYLYDLPAQFRNLKLKDRYTFVTTRGIDTYAFNSEGYTSIEQPAYCMKREIALFQDPWSFFALNFNWQYQNNFAYGDSTIGQGPYTGFTSAKPIIRSVNNNPVFAANPNYPASRVQNILITVNNSLGETQNVTDDGFGNLIQVLSTGTVLNAGTINYETGAISVTFNVPVDQGQPIQIQYNPTTLSIPLSILFFQNQFTLRPVPDRGYTIELIAYRQPSQALSQTPGGLGSPELKEWWELIAVGIAKKFYEDTRDDENIMSMDKMLKEKYSLAETRNYAQLGTQRISTLFADQLTNNYGNIGFGQGQGSV